MRPAQQDVAGLPFYVRCSAKVEYFSMLDLARRAARICSCRTLPFLAAMHGNAMPWRNAALSTVSPCSTSNLDADRLEPHRVRVLMRFLCVSHVCTSQLLVARPLNGTRPHPLMSRRPAPAPAPALQLQGLMGEARAVFGECASRAPPATFHAAASAAWHGVAANIDRASTCPWCRSADAAAASSVLPSERTKLRSLMASARSQP